MLDIIPYKLKLYKYKDGIFDNIIDATYIIYTEGNNERYENIKNGLEKIKPSKKVYILENKGWRKSKKKEYITNTSKDLVDCNIHIFKHAKKKGYDNILILEDDYIFDKKIEKSNIIKNIENFILKKKDESFSFYLGTIPFIFLPYNLNINRGLINIYTHSIIFSKKYRNKVLNYNYKNISCWDVFQNYFNYNKYYYNIPLSYQIIEETENSLNWEVPNIVRKIYLKVAYMLKANINPIIFFNMWYIFSYILIVIIILVIIILLIKYKKKN